MCDLISAWSEQTETKIILSQIRADTQTLLTQIIADIEII